MSRRILIIISIVFINLLPIWFDNELHICCHGETVYLKGIENGISVEVDKVTGSYIIVNIKKAIISNISIRPDISNSFADIINLKDLPQKRIRCNVIGFTQEAYIIQIPMNEIRSLEMNQKGIIGSNKAQKASEKSIEPDNDALGMELLEDIESKDEIKGDQIARSDLLIKETLIDIDNKADTLDKGITPDTTANPAETGGLDWIKEELKQEIIKEMTQKKEEEEEKLLKESTGIVEGKILKKGKPLPDCKVQIVALSQERVFFSSSIKRGSSFETFTDENGRYILEDVPPGHYKIFWKPSYETSWIRRLNMEPDVVVNAGKTAYPKDIDVHGRVLN